METKQIQKAGVSKYGPYLKDADQFMGCTEQVQKYLTDKVPCEVEVQETTGEGRDEKISKVRILNSNAPALGSKQEGSKDKLASVCLSYAKDLVVAGKLELADIGKYAAIFMTTVTALSEGKTETPEVEPKGETPQPAEGDLTPPSERVIDTQINEDGTM